MRSLPLSLPVAVALTLLPAVVGCGGDSSPGGAQQYPLVDGTSPLTSTTYETDASPTCERAIATFHDGSEPAKRPIVIPPAPGLRATAITKHTTRLEWSFQSLPDDCRPVELLVSVVARGRSTPTTERVKIGSLAGTAEITYAEFLPVPDVALASAYSREGHRSRTVGVLIRRTGNLPPDPEPTPTLSAPAGEPAQCAGRATAVEDPAGDVLTHEVGSPPAPVAELTPALSGIDIRRATVQIEGRMICASLLFAGPPPSDGLLQLTLTLRDVTTPTCCASIRFRRTSGGLEVGYLSVDANGAYRLDPVPKGGASLRGNTLVITGTLPEPDAWEMQTRRMPAAEDLGWSVSSNYIPEKYGPSYGDWLPRYEAAGEPVIRHRDGATVTPG